MITKNKRTIRRTIQQKNKIIVLARKERTDDVCIT